MSSVYETPAVPAADTAVDLNAYLLQEGFVPACLDGQVVAVPLHPGPETPALIPALVDGKVIAVPVHNPLAAATTAATAHAQPGPAPAAVPHPAADPGLPKAVRDCLLYGSIAAVAAGGAVWMLGAAVGEVAPHAEQLGHLLKMAAIAVGAVVIGVAALLGKLRSVSAGAGAAAATASGDGASATGTVLTLFNRTHTTTIGKQSAGWRGSITNNNG
ncbi:hypothetical protein [Kitasatospora sp. MBT63]|uniref:hypothetical protein n=1 Tax=Kitasatospora sp. MBT63 TaxID=1444768 RepID=UPI00053A17F3|nr:hypothetical protein [Kitasatospora sp. MBT63]